MRYAKLISAALAVLFLASSFVIVAAPDGSEAASEKAYDCYSSRNYYKTSNPVVAAIGFYNSNSDLVFVSASDTAKLADYDERVRQYLDFESNDRYLPATTGDLPAGDYYVYSSSHERGYSPSGFELERMTSTKTNKIIPLMGGDYTISVRVVEKSSENDTVYLRSYDDGYENSVAVTDGGEYVIKHNGPTYYYFSINPSGSNSATVRYTITPDTAYEEHSATESHILNIGRSWAAASADIEAGQIRWYSQSQIVFKDGTPGQERFEREVVEAGKVCSAEDAQTEYGAIDTDSVFVWEGGSVKIYWTTDYTTQDTTHLNYSIRVGMQDIFRNIQAPVSYFDRPADDEYVFYASANQNFDIAVEYDDTRYIAYIVDDHGEKYPLLSGILYHIENSYGMNYRLQVGVKYTGSGTVEIDALSTDVRLYTENLPESDSSAPVFAAVSIGLCVVAFAVLLGSGFKPKWSKVKKN